MKFWVDNWSFVVVVLAMIACAVLYVKKFVELPDEEQLIKVREFLLWAVIEAERTYGGKVGVIKLRYVYSLFCEHFPSFVAVIPFDLFEKMVDGALEQMKHLLESNAKIYQYVHEFDEKEAET